MIMELTMILVNYLKGVKVVQVESSFFNRDFCLRVIVFDCLNIRIKNCWSKKRMG